MVWCSKLGTLGIESILVVFIVAAIEVVTLYKQDLLCSVDLTEAPNPLTAISITNSVQVQSPRSRSGPQDKASKTTLSHCLALERRVSGLLA